MKAGIPVTAALGLALLSGACDFLRPSGPGPLDARVLPGGTGAAAAVVVLSGSGIRGFEGSGDTRLFAGRDPNDPDRHRVVLVNPGPGDLRFRVWVDDRSDELPTGIVVEAADTANAEVAAPGQLEIRIER